MEKQKLTESEKAYAKAALRDIGLALSACNNTIATDDVDAKPDETHWRINNADAIQKVEALELMLALNV